MATMQQAIDNVVVKLAMEATAARQEEQTMIAEAFNNHSSLGGNYWQYRWQAEQKLKTALLLQEAFHE